MLYVISHINNFYKLINNSVPSLFCDIKTVTCSEDPRIVITAPEPFIDNIEKSLEDAIIIILDDNGKNCSPRIEVKSENFYM